MTAYLNRSEPGALLFSRRHGLACDGKPLVKIWASNRMRTFLLPCKRI